MGLWLYPAGLAVLKLAQIRRKLIFGIELSVELLKFLLKMLLWGVAGVLAASGGFVKEIVGKENETLLYCVTNRVNAYLKPVLHKIVCV